MLTPEEFKNEMIKIKNFEGDGKEYFSLIEDNHRMADSLMCNLLSELGYKDGVDIFRNMKKWYS